MTFAASFNACEAFFSPSAAITWRQKFCITKIEIKIKKVKLMHNKP